MKRKTVIITSVVILSIFIFALLLSLFMSVVHGATIDDLNNKKNKITEQKQENATEMKKTAENKKRIDTEMVVIENDINAIKAKMDQTQEILDETEKELALATQNVDMQNAIFKERVRIMYEKGTVSYLELLLTSKNLFDMMSKIEAIKEVASYDKKVLTQMQEVQASIDEKKQLIEQKKKEQQDEKKQIDAKFAAQKRLSDENDNHIKELKKNKENLDKAEEEANRSIEAEFRRLSAKSSSSSNSTYTGGEFMWPVNSTNITSYFGGRNAPTAGASSNHKGVDIAAPSGTPIFAANNGTVQSAGYMNAIGNCVMIDHGGGRMTVYGHMKSISVSAGSTVTKGQQIGTVGSTGVSTGPHLHFEVRIDGSAVNPMQYFK